MRKYKHLNFLIIPTLNEFPFIENDFDAVTYYQLLCKLAGQLNEVVDQFNSMIDDFNELEDEFTEVKNLVNELNSRFDSFEAMILERFNELETNIDNRFDSLETELKTTINNELSHILDEFNTLTNYVNNQILEFKDYVDAKNLATYTALSSRCDDLQNQINNIDVSRTCYNPALGNRTSFQDAINDLWIWLRYDGMLTASQYDSLNITAGDYDNMQIKARDFDLYAKKILIN